MTVAFRLAIGLSMTALVGSVACSSDDTPSRGTSVPGSGGSGATTGGAGAGLHEGSGGTAGKHGGSGGTAGDRAGSGGAAGGRQENGGAAGTHGVNTAGDSGTDSKVNVPYECIGGEVAREVVDGGGDADVEVSPSELVVVPWTQSVGTCTAGETYCSVHSGQKLRDALPTRTCEPVPAACTGSPNCACLCSHGLPCQYVNCSCKDDADGRAIWACEQI